MNATETQIIHLNLPAKLDFLPGATALVREVIGKLGLDDKDTRRLELVVEEACVNVIQNSFDDDKGDYDIAVLRRPGQIIVAVEDRGLPIDFKRLEADSESGLGVVLMKAFADEVQFINLGRRGKRVEIVKNLPEKDLDKFLREAAAQTPAERASLSISESDITIRLMRPDETINLARCAYRCYGYTYASDHIYYPERSREMVASGLMISVVAVNPQDEIIGHLAVVKETPQALTGESGQAIVDPRYRSNGIHKRMGFLLSDINKASGMVGTFGEAVTVHPYSQKSALTRGYIETGILLGFVPTSMYFKQLQSEAAEKRRAVLLMYKRLNEEPQRDVYLPPHHAGMLTRIYENSKLRRNFVSGPLPELPERSQVNVNVRPEINWAFLRVVEYGQDIEEVVKFRVKELCQRRIDCIYLELPLCHPAVQRFCAPLEMQGFFFGGISPEMVDGDLLRLQYFNNVDLELKDIQLATDFAKDMLQYVLKAGGY
jgi:anti-sigma regulatory factor (Ser/Thr protein kinase)